MVVAIKIKYVEELSVRSHILQSNDQYQHMTITHILTLKMSHP